MPSKKKENDRIIIDDYINRYNSLLEQLESLELDTPAKLALKRSGMGVIAQIAAITKDNNPSKLQTLKPDVLSTLNQTLTLCSQAVTDLKNGTNVKKTCKELHAASNKLPRKSSIMKPLSAALLSFVGAVMIVGGIVAMPFTMGLSGLASIAGGAALGSGAATGISHLTRKKEGAPKATDDFSKAVQKQYKENIKATKKANKAATKADKTAPKDEAATTDTDALKLPTPK